MATTWERMKRTKMKESCYRDAVAKLVAAVSLKYCYCSFGLVAAEVGKIGKGPNCYYEDVEFDVVVAADTEID